MSVMRSVGYQGSRYFTCETQRGAQKAGVANFGFTAFSEVREKASNNRSFEGCAVRLRACRLIYASSDGTRAE